MDQMLWNHFAALKKLYDRALEPVYKQFHISRNELDVVLFLANNPEYQRATDIVELRGIAKSHVSMAVSRLEKAGLLIRIEDPRDRRCACLRLTEKAGELAAAGQEAQRKFFRAVHQGITHEEWKLAEKITGKLWENASKLEEL